MCSAKNDGLVRYPTVRASVFGDITVRVQCADNAYNDGTSSMVVLCDSTGVWRGFLGYYLPPQCRCNSGYRIATVESRQICQGLSTLKKVISSPNVSF